jgi:UDP-2,3-diacylglucosamine hydrolase
MTDTEVNMNAHLFLLGDWINHFSYGEFDGEKFELKVFKA